MFMNKFDECYDFSDKLVNAYIDLVTSPIYLEDVVMYNSMIDNIKEMVLDEYDLLKSLSLDEVRDFLNKISVLEFENKDYALYRLKCKLIDCEQILFNSYINGSNFGNGNITSNMNFCLYDIIVSSINIDIIKSINNKINSVIANSDRDKHFIELLKNRLEVAKFTFLYSTTTSEMLSLDNNGDIELIPRIDINFVKNKVLNIKGVRFDEIFNESLMFFSRELADIFKGIRVVNNNPVEVFNYLAIVTQLETFLSYMDRDMLEALYSYCCSVSNSSNKAIMDNAKRLVLRKIKNLDELV